MCTVLYQAARRSFVCAHEHGSCLGHDPASAGFPADKAAMLGDTTKGTHVFKARGAGRYSYKNSI